MGAKHSIQEIASILAGDVPPAMLAALSKDTRAGVQKLLAQREKRQAKEQAENARLKLITRFERDYWQAGQMLVAGVDEAGAGPLAGPVVAAAVILPEGLLLKGMNDSKKLSEKVRLRLDQEIRKKALAFAIAEVSAEEIDTINIYRACLEAMRRAVLGLEQTPDVALVDARTISDIGVPQKAIIGGDAHSHTIAAASILAKVHRDALMAKIAREFPQYGFEGHKGYGTKAHMEALRLHGPCPWHRMSFAPVRESAAAQRP